MSVLRSNAHMLAVAAARLEADHANPKLIADLRAAAKEEAAKIGEGRNWSQEEERRVDRQRSLFNAIINGPDKGRLQEAMLHRAYDLMWDGNCAGCDALIEFLPSLEVEKMFAAWESDQLGKDARSRFYEGTSP